MTLELPRSVFGVFNLMDPAIGTLVAGSTIDVTGLSYDTVNSATSGQLTMSGVSAPLTLAIAPTYAGMAFQATPDGHGGTDVTLGAPCFVAGTCIATPDGWRAVETLAPGDLVATV